MAEFNITPESQPTGSYTGMSQGIYADRNDALGRLFGNLADTLEAGVQAADQAVVSQIEEDAFNEVELIRQEFGGAYATTLEEDIDTGVASRLPEHIQQSVDTLAGLQSSFAAGNLRESHYWARLNSAVRQLRSRYPGYRREIDQAVSGLVGVTPANALQSALFSDWREAASAVNSESDRYNKLVDDAIRAGTLPPDFFQREKEGNRYELPELMHYVAERNRMDQDMQTRRAEMALDADVRGVNERTALKNYQADSEMFVARVLYDTNKAIGRNYQEIQSRIMEAQNAAARGQSWNQEEIVQLQAAANELRNQILLKLQEEFNAEWFGNPDHSYSKYITPEDRDSVINSALAPVDLMIEALGGEALNIVEYNQALVDAVMTDAGRRLITQYPAVADIAALSSTAGLDMANIYLSAVEDVQNSLVASFVQGENIKAGLGQNRGNIYEALTVIEQNQGDLPEDLPETLLQRWENVADMWSDGEISDELLRNNVDYMFSPDASDILSKFSSREDRLEYFTRAVSPRVTKIMMDLRDEGDVEAWRKYQSWVGNGFIQMFSQYAEVLNQTLAQGFEVTWDDANTQFVVSGQAHQNPLNTAMAGGLSMATSNLTRTLHQDISGLNKAIQSVAPILIDEGGDVGIEMIQLMEGMGFDPSTPTEQRSMLQVLFDGLVTVFAGQQE